ncbi:MAG TPA: sugar transferase [Bryobacteraceae bacterium]|nr:sugar transferase [Bryobacteraceae bacterium]
MTRIFDLYISRSAILLALIEGLAIAACLAAAVRFTLPEAPGHHTAGLAGFVPVIPILAVFQIAFYYNDLYHFAAFRNSLLSALRLGQSLGAGCLALAALYYAAPALMLERTSFLLGLALVAISSGLTRALVALWRTRGPVDNVAIIGCGTLALTVAREINRREDLHLRLLGLVDEAPWQHRTSAGSEPVIGSMGDLPALVEENRVSRLIVAVEDNRRVLPVRGLVGLRLRGVKIEDAASALASLTGRVWLSVVRPSWFVYAEGFRRSKLTLAVKRAVDIVVSAVAIVICAPLVPLIAAAIRLDSRGPVFYRQTRVGYQGRTFQLLKFRSMHENAERANEALWAREQDPRSTRVGRFLRKSRLDELPQFINVLRGEMSFVGPRPERPAFVEQLRKEIPYYDERHSVRPGITGWAQVRYRYGASVNDAERKLEYDLFYLKNMSLAFDMLIAFETVRIVLFGRGAR